MIEVLQLPSGHSAVTMQNRIVMAINAHDFQGVNAAYLLVQVAENLKLITGESINTPAMKQPPEGWTWEDVLVTRMSAIEFQKAAWRDEAEQAGITIVRNDEGEAIDQWTVLFAGDEPQTELYKSIESNVYDDEYELLKDVSEFLESVRNGTAEAPAPGM